MLQTRPIDFCSWAIYDNEVPYFVVNQKVMNLYSNLRDLFTHQEHKSFNAISSF